MELTQSEWLKKHRIFSQMGKDGEVWYADGLDGYRATGLDRAAVVWEVERAYGSFDRYAANLIAMERDVIHH